MNNVARPSCSKKDDTKIGAGTIGDADGPEGAEGTVDITKPDKTNKICILVSY